MNELLQDTNVWVAVSFVLFVILVFRIAKDRILTVLDGRIEEIRKDIDTAESLRIEAQELLAQYQRKQRDAAKEAEYIVAQAREHANQLRSEAAVELNQSMKRREDQIHARLKMMEEKAISDIRAHAAELAVRATREIIIAEVNEKTNSQYIAKSIKSVSEKFAG
jgi:F-type H+-transporting ATPase subunit b